MKDLRMSLDLRSTRKCTALRAIEPQGPYLFHHPQKSFHPAARKSTGRRSLQQNAPESHRGRIGDTKRDEGLNGRKEQIERTNLMTASSAISLVTQKLKPVAYSGRKSGGNTRASAKAIGDRENGFESMVSIRVGCCFFPLGI